MACRGSGAELLQSIIVFPKSLPLQTKVERKLFGREIEQKRNRN
jgi:hypothetical protein